MSDDKLGMMLQGEFDAAKWASEFQTHIVDGGITIDQELMVGWFANAIMAGFDYARNHPEEADSTVILSPTALDDITSEPREMKPFTFSYTDGQGSYCDNPDEGNLTLHEAVFQALGYASVCWSEAPTGIFESDRCKEAGDALIAFVEDML